MIDFHPRDADHVVLKPPCSLVCQRCGDRVIIQPPVSLKSLGALAQAYADLHRDCASLEDACDRCTRARSTYCLSCVHAQGGD